VSPQGVESVPAQGFGPGSCEGIPTHGLVALEAYERRGGEGTYM